MMDEEELRELRVNQLLIELRVRDRMRLWRAVWELFLWVGLVLGLLLAAGIILLGE
jgi:hypothetical protein